MSEPLKAGRELDALVAEKVMGLRVAGRCCAVFVEGEWSIHPDSEPAGWACYAGIEPVYARADCDCAEPLVREYESPEKAALYAEIDAEREKRQSAAIAKTGHRTYCLRIVPNYSTEIAAAWEVLEKIGRATEIRWHPKAEQHVLVMIGVYDTPGGVAEAETVPLAICLAALEVVRARPTEQETQK